MYIYTQYEIYSKFKNIHYIITQTQRSTSTNICGEYAHL